MGTATGMTAAAMQAIADGTVVDGEVVGDNLILELRSGKKIDAGHVRGTPGAPGGTDEAFGTWIRNVNSNTRDALADIFDQNKRRVGLKRNCVIVGPNFSVNDRWGIYLAAEYNLIEQNLSYPEGFASGFTIGNTFLSQLQAAVAATGFDNDDVALVVISDASHDVRRWTDAGATVSVTTAASAAFQYAKTNFPNARIICVPIIWPADPDVATAGTIGYQNIWSYAVSEITQQIRNVAMLHGVETVEDSHTWLTGQTGLMAANNATYANNGGNRVIARWISAHLKGNRTRSDSGWMNVTHLPASMASPEPGIPRFRARREGWNVIYNGGLRTQALAGTPPVDLVQFPVGFRPAGYGEIRFRHNGGSLQYPGEIHHNGFARVWAPMAVGLDFLTSGSFTLY